MSALYEAQSHLFAEYSSLCIPRIHFPAQLNDGERSIESKIKVTLKVSKN
jgi:hypothetical protein